MLANNSQDPISKKPSTKNSWWSGSRFKPQYHKTKNKTNNNNKKT
jgi:hypothetical protein